MKIKLVLAGMLPVALAVIAGALGGFSSSATATAPSPSDRAAALAAAPDAAALDVQTFATPQEAQGAAAAIEDDYPLPQGGSFVGIRWEDVDGGVTLAFVKSTLQYNAACQWWRSLAQGRDLSEATKVVGTIPNWPMFRQQEAGSDNPAPLIAAAVAQGKPGADAVPAATLASCGAMVDRMSVYAAARGVVGPR